MKQKSIHKLSCRHLRLLSFVALILSVVSCSNLRTIKSLDRLRFTESDLQNNCSVIRYDGVYFEVVHDSIYPTVSLYFKPCGQIYEIAGGRYGGIYRQAGDTIYANLYEDNGGLGVTRWRLWRSKIWATDSVTLKYTTEIDPEILKEIYGNGYEEKADTTPPNVVTFHFVKTPIMPPYTPDMMKRSWMWESKAEWKAWKREQKRRKKEGVKD